MPAWNSCKNILGRDIWDNLRYKEKEVNGRRDLDEVSMCVLLKNTCSLTGHKRNGCRLVGILRK